MDVRHALLAVLATVPLTACPATTDCNPLEEEFAIDETLSDEQLDKIVSDYGLLDRDAIVCNTACTVAYESRGWEVNRIDSCSYTPPSSPSGDAQVSCTGMGYEYLCNEGRRPLGHIEAGGEGSATPLGRSLAAMAYLEAASVEAFEQLADALAAWAAPTQLIERCRAAAEDERNHARWLTALAATHGAHVPKPTQVSEVSTTRLAFAENNAREGCVHETFAALIAGVRARRAPDARVRQLFTRIAADETRHAQLAWDLDAWFRTQLDADASARVEAVRAQALAQLPERIRGLAQLPAALGPLEDADVERLATELCGRLATGGATHRGSSLGLFAEGFGPETCSTPGTA